jgi:capsular exopolysaccharide synthesis family protein
MNRQNRILAEIGATDATNKREILNFIFFIYRRWSVIVAMLVFCLLCGGVVILLTVPQYTATAQILFSPPREKTVGSEGSLYAPLDSSALGSQIALIKSTAILQQVVESEGILHDSEFVAGQSLTLFERLKMFFSLSGTKVDEGGQEPIEHAIAALKQRLVVDRVAQTYVIMISIWSREPTKAALLANSLANTYIADRLKMRLGDSQRSVRLINPATVPIAPSYPRTRIILLAAICGGLLLGLGAAFALEAFTVGFVTPQQTEQILGIPVLAMIPKLTRADYEAIRSNIVDVPRLILTMPFTRISEAIRTLRNLVQTRNSHGKAKIVQVTSAVPSEGKTTVAMCLAASAASSGKKVVIVDCDLRKSTLSAYHNLGRTAGLIDVLEGVANLDETLRIDSESNVYVVPAGRPTDDPTNLLASDCTKDILARLSELFDLVVIDSPPLDPVVDSLVLAQLVDHIVLVIKWNSTPQPIVRTNLNMLIDKNESVSAVLNFIDSKRALNYDRDAYSKLDSKRYQAYN